MTRRCCLGLGGIFVVSLLLLPLQAAQIPVTTSPASIDKDTVWGGTIVVDNTTTLRSEAHLIVKPGTVVRFRKNATLVIEGTLLAEGSKDSPIRFISDNVDAAPGEWVGIRFAGAHEGSLISHGVIQNASIAVQTEMCAPEIRDSVIENGITGMVVDYKSGPAIRGNVIRKLSNGGIQIQRSATPTLTGNTFEACSPYGVGTTKDAAPSIRDNLFAGCTTGLVLSATVPPVENNRFRENGTGMTAQSLNDQQILRGNRFDENETGMRLENFSVPLVENNMFSGNRDALVCYHSSSPMIRNNSFEKNGRGIVCDRISSPRIQANDLHGNRTAIYLNFSSYAVIHENNLYANEIQLELSYMSSDWETRIGGKPERGGQMQRINRVNRGVAGPKELVKPAEDRARIMGFVDATGNWWGDEDTAEMEKKGPDADIKRLIDGHDVPTRSYEGYPGEYAQDRIKYEGWKKTRIPDAGTR